MKVVVDTNVLISAFLSPDGVSARIFKQLEQEAFELLVSEPILAEYEKVLRYDRVRQRHKLSDEQIKRAVEDLRTSATLVEPTVALTVVEGDPDDDKFFECALDGGAQLIVSGDLRVQAVKEHRGIRVFSPALFLALLQQ